MNMEKFTTRSREIIDSAVNNAVAQKRQFVKALDILQALLSTNDKVIEKLIAQSGGDVNMLKIEVENEIKKLPQVSGNIQTVASQDFSMVVLNAEQLAEKANDKFGQWCCSCCKPCPLQPTMRLLSY